MSRLRNTARARIRGWSARRHGIDDLPIKIERRRIYILPTRFGLMMTALLIAMLIAGLNYTNNLGLAFTFLLVSVMLVAMHHCHRNLLALTVDVNVEVDAFAGADAAFYFMLRNESAVDRRDIEVRLAPASGPSRGKVEAARSVAVGSHEEVMLAVPVARRGVSRWDHVELRTTHPFGWFRAWTYVQAPLTAFVAPRPQGNRPLRAPVSAAGERARSESRGDEDFAGLRSYTPGVPLKHMAWKTLARGGEPTVRVYDDLAGRPEWLDWSLLDGLDDEARLSQLCRWISECERGHPRPYGLRIPGVEIPPGLGPAHRSRCLRALACHGWERP